MYILTSNLIFVLKIIFIWIEIHIYMNEQKENVCAKRHIYIDINSIFVYFKKYLYVIRNCDTSSVS